MGNLADACNVVGVCFVGFCKFFVKLGNNFVELCNLVVQLCVFVIIFVSLECVVLCKVKCFFEYIVLVFEF